MTSSAVTGSSAMHAAWARAPAPGDGDALAHAAGELVRIVGAAAARRGPTMSNSSTERARAAARDEAAALGQHLVELRADACRPGRASSWRSAERRRCRASAARWSCASSSGAGPRPRRRSRPPAMPGVRGHHADDGARQPWSCRSRIRPPGRRSRPRARRTCAPSTARADAAARAVVDLRGPRRARIVHGHQSRSFGNRISS